MEPTAAMPDTEERYREIIAAVDAEFERNRNLYGSRMRCGPGCVDCCHHIFAISHLEADRIADALGQLDPALRQTIESRAERYIEQRLIRGDRIPCPALHEGVCSIYESRPLMCRKFGMPLYNPEKPGQIFACELNFRDGEEIRDPQLIRIQTDIHERWKDLRSEYDTRSGSRQDGLLTVAHAILRARERL